jgi:protein O-mannosyl-transferase
MNCVGDRDTRPRAEGSQVQTEIDGKEPGSVNHWRFEHWHILLGVLAATFIAYARTLSFEFVYDDFSQLVNNPAIHSWHYLPEYFTKNVWAEVYPGVQGNYYRPVFLIWCRINSALFANQAGLWHLTTVLAHLLATALVYFLVLHLVHDRLTAGLASLIFGVHPVHIEAVAWVSAVTEPLLGVFFLSAFLCYFRWRDKGPRSGTWLALALFLGGLGMLEKETAVMLPAVISVYAWLYAEGAGTEKTAILRKARAAAREAFPFLLLAIVYLIARIAALRGFSHDYAPIPWPWVFYTWPALLWFWIKHLAVPIGLGSNYDLRTVMHPGMMNLVLPAVAVAAVAVALGWGAKRSRNFAFACAWLVLPLLPLLDIRILAPDDVAHDRYLYLPSVGLAILVALALRKVGKSPERPRGALPVQAFAALVLAVAFGIGTWTQSFYFKNNWIFYRYNYFLAPLNPYAENNYGAILARLGMRDEAIKVLKRGTEANPGYWSLAYNLGRNYYIAGNSDLAETSLLRAIAIDPSKDEAFYCLGLARLEAGNPGGAETAFRVALGLNPHGQEYHYELGLALKQQGKLKEALQEFLKDSRRNRTYPDAMRQSREIQQQLEAARPSPNGAVNHGRSGPGLER